MVRLLNRSEAWREFGLSVRQIYAAVERGEIRAVEHGSSRPYYLADELEALAERISNRRLTHAA